MTGAAAYDRETVEGRQLRLCLGPKQVVGSGNSDTRPPGMYLSLEYVTVLNGPGLMAIIFF